MQSQKPMNREQRAAIAQQTLTILNSGVYQPPGKEHVAIGEALEFACVHTRLYRPEEYTSLLAQIATRPRYTETVIRVSAQTTLAAGRALVTEFPTVACLNFASAKHPGGGFLGGSQAQEESLARASGLYATLQTQPEFYAFHKRLRTSLYSDHLIFSPLTPVFRDDADQLLDQPWRAAFITTAAVNAGAIRQNEPKRQGEIRPIMEQRTRMVLAVAAAQQCETLVLGAWGCGVFQNDPQMIAAIFANVLVEPPFQNRFRHIEFAIYDTTPKQSILAAFSGVFNQR